MDEITDKDISQSLYSHFKQFNNINDKINFLEIYFGVQLKWYQKLLIKILSIKIEQHERNFMIFEKYAEFYNEKKKKKGDVNK